MYKFVTLDKFEEIKPKLLKVMEDNQVRGTLLLAQEGINGTVAGTRQAIDNPDLVATRPTPQSPGMQRILHRQQPLSSH